MKHLKSPCQSHKESPCYDRDEFPTNLLPPVWSHRVHSFPAAYVPSEMQIWSLLYLRLHSDSSCLFLHPRHFSFPYPHPVFKSRRSGFLQIPNHGFSLMCLPLLLSRPGMLFTQSSGGHILFIFQDATQLPLSRNPLFAPSPSLEHIVLISDIPLITL